MSVCKPWQWPYAPSSRRPLDHIWARLKLQWCIDSVSRGWGSGHRCLSPQCSRWLIPCTTFLASIGHSCVSLTSSGEHACEWDWSLLEHRADVGCLRLTRSSSLGLDAEWWDLWELWFFGRRRGHQSNLANRHFNPKLTLFQRKLDSQSLRVTTSVQQQSRLTSHDVIKCLGNGLKYVCSKLFAVFLHKYEQIYELYQSSYCLIIKVEI